MKNNQQKALIRVCASCERVFITTKECPCCGFASYGSIWAIGFWKTMLGLVVHPITKPRNEKLAYFKRILKKGNEN
jgi:RNA polymerase subunit RPABC4/transcription elongation factor Spt4